ncbi:MAG: class I SAM-dependent methyltransferase [Chloroflexota bacterium]|nr:MAG: hypothetical protein DIU68_21105 [Chloroflexota bacterium]
MSRQAFDILAPHYDATFTASRTGSYLRQRARNRLYSHLKPGDVVLELGCGSGEDALWLAQHHIRVIATDASVEMLRLTRAKTAHTGLVRVEQLELDNLPARFPPSDADRTPLFDAVLANFGPLNCLNDWRPLADWLATRVRPGGIAAFGIMSRYCLWEIVWHGLHGNIRHAIRRLGGKAQFRVPGDKPNKPMEIHYPTVRRLERDFAPWFRRVGLMPLGLALPPSDVYPVIERRPRLCVRLMALEEWLSSASWLAQLADHYWIEFERIGYGSP